MLLGVVVLLLGIDIEVLFMLVSKFQVFKRFYFVFVQRSLEHSLLGNWPSSDEEMEDLPSCGSSPATFTTFGLQMTSAHGVLSHHRGNPLLSAARALIGPLSTSGSVSQARLTTEHRCIELSVHERRLCVDINGVCYRWHVSQGMCITGGMCHRGRVSQGHVSQGACVTGGVCDRSCVSQVACMSQGGVVTCCTLLSRHCTLLSRHCTLLSRHCTLLSRHCTLLSRHCTQLSRHCTLLSRHCTLLSRHCTQLSRHCTQLCTFLLMHLEMPASSLLVCALQTIVFACVCF
jgi:hypothetical protein